MKRSAHAVLSLVVFIALLCVGATADATTAVLLSREELVLRSATVARVIVGQSYTTESDDGRSIVTRTELKVTQPLKGMEADKGRPKVLLLEEIGGT